MGLMPNPSIVEDDRRQKRHQLALEKQRRCQPIIMLLRELGELRGEHFTLHIHGHEDKALDIRIESVSLAREHLVQR